MKIRAIRVDKLRFELKILRLVIPMKAPKKRLPPSPIKIFAG